jgi:hypothetical protein
MAKGWTHEAGYAGAAGRSGLLSGRLSAGTVLQRADATPAGTKLLCANVNRSPYWSITQLVYRVFAAFETTILAVICYLHSFIRSKHCGSEERRANSLLMQLSGTTRPTKSFEGEPRRAFRRCLLNLRQSQTETLVTQARPTDCLSGLPSAPKWRVFA